MRKGHVAWGILALGTLALAGCAKRADAPVVSDGPFPETKEYLAGFWIVECPSAERAIAIAAKASTAPGPGGRPMGVPIEIRQVPSGPPIDG